jgi:translation initiation factor 2 alpha subunit (eIF-2alpha)
MEIKQDELVLCTVTKIEGTTVFVNIEEYNLPATIVFSEIAAGRIRNIREYVVPNKKIVCKVLKIHPDHIELSFRRVTAFERDSITERYKQEQTFKGMLKSITKDSEKIIKGIKAEMSLSDFSQKIREDPKILSKFFSKEEAEKIKKILSEKKEKEKEAKKIFTLKSDSPSGLKDIKEILGSKEKNIKVSYLGSSQFAVSCKGKDFKEANQTCLLFIESAKEKAKSKKAFFESKED